MTAIRKPSAVKNLFCSIYLSKTVIHGYDNPHRQREENIISQYESLPWVNDI